jgi:LmbE family N-acetylglucosaminyl deacetylase
MAIVAIVAPHPDDETLGCGGTLLKHRDSGDEVHWIIVTQMELAQGFSSKAIEDRENTITAVASLYGFSGVHKLGFPTTSLDSQPKAKLVSEFRHHLEAIQPSLIYLPFPGDVHNDHTVSFDAAVACTKSFRASYLKQVLAYETLSETEQGMDPRYRPFLPNVWVNIESFLERKLEIMARCYSSELAPFPFPRSETTIRALAALRGSTVSVPAAEAFMLIKEIR